VELVVGVKLDEDVFGAGFPDVKAPVGGERIRLRVCGADDTKMIVLVS